MCSGCCPSRVEQLVAKIIDTRALLTQLLPSHSPIREQFNAGSSLCRTAARPPIDESASIQLLLLITYASAAAPQLYPLQLLLPNCIRFSCCSPTVSASAAAPRLHPLQLLLPNCIRFSCCSAINALHASLKYSTKVMRQCPIQSCQVSHILVRHTHLHDILCSHACTSKCHAS